MDATTDKSSNMNENSESSDNSNQDTTITVDKRTFWLIVAVVLVCMSILGICVVLVLWKKFCRRRNDASQYQQECVNPGKTDFSNNRGHHPNSGAGEYQQQFQSGKGEMSSRDSGNGHHYGARPKGSVQGNVGQVNINSSQYVSSQEENNILRSYNNGSSERLEDDDSQPPCLNCSLIQQGSAISYGDNRCPQCGRDVGM